MVDKFLRKYRLINGLTQAALAEKLSISQNAVSQYESGKRTPRWPKLNKLLDTLNISADEILGRDITVRDNEDYEVKLAKEDLQILSQIKASPKLYKALLANPERNVQVINNNLKHIFPEM